MNEDTGQLTESFVAHESLAPDSAEVLAKANAIARSYQRRRWVVRATGTAFVGAGLVAGGIAAPGLTSHKTSQTIHAADGAGTGTAAEGNTSYTHQQEEQAFFAAGYTYDDAQQIAAAWHDDRGVTKIKAAAGLKLLQGDTLPVEPSGIPESADERAAEAFFNAGYGYNDAVTLSHIWNESVSQAKVDGGKKVEAGETLPIQPTGDNSEAGGASTSASTNPAFVSKLGLAKKRGLLLRHGKFVVAPGGAAASGSDLSPQEEAEETAFFNAGYVYGDAVKLSKIWNETDLTKVKTEAGQKLIDGDSLPVDPSGPKIEAENQDVHAFFNAGYSYDDAVALGKMWHESSYQAKIDGGKKIETGETLPIQPSN